MDVIKKLEIVHVKGTLLVKIAINALHNISDFLKVIRPDANHVTAILVALQTTNVTSSLDNVHVNLMSLVVDVMKLWMDISLVLLTIYFLKVNWQVVVKIQ